MQVLRLDTQNCSFTRSLTDLDTEQLLNIISNTLQNWSGHRSHDYVELQNLNLITDVQNLIASNFKEIALQYAISRARDGLFTIDSTCTSAQAAHVAEDLQALEILMLLLCSLIFFVLKEVNSPEAGQDLGMFLLEGPEDEHFVYDVTC